jgi:hypothetical protein
VVAGEDERAKDTGGPGSHRPGRWRTDAMRKAWRLWTPDAGQLTCGGHRLHPILTTAQFGGCKIGYCRNYRAGLARPRALPTDDLSAIVRDCRQDL